MCPDSDCSVSFEDELLPENKPFIHWTDLKGIDLDYCRLCYREGNYNVLLPMYEERKDAQFEIEYCTKHGPIINGPWLKGSV